MTCDHYPSFIEPNYRAIPALAPTPTLAPAPVSPVVRLRTPASADIWWLLKHVHMVGKHAVGILMEFFLVIIGSAPLHFS